MAKKYKSLTPEEAYMLAELGVRTEYRLRIGRGNPWWVTTDKYRYVPSSYEPVEGRPYRYDGKKYYTKIQIRMEVE